MKEVVLPKAGERVTAKDIAGMIDHSLLKPEMTTEQVAAGCELARRCGCVTVCVKPSDVALAAGILQGSDTLTTTVIGFPHGSNLTEVKLLEARIAMDQGCKELDVVINIGRMKSGEYDYVEKDIKAVVDAAHARGVKVKVILENFYLTDDEIAEGSRIVERAGGDWVKTSTGYAGGGATVHDLKIMRANASGDVQVKAAGGVRTLDAALAVRALGGTRFGCTATEAMLEEAKKREAAGTLVIPADVPDNAIGY